jgi:hypothetical protein
MQPLSGLRTSELSSKARKHKSVERSASNCLLPVTRPINNGEKMWSSARTQLNYSKLNLAHRLCLPSCQTKAHRPICAGLEVVAI